MNDRPGTIQKYRDRAGTLRQEAEAIEDPEHRRIVLLIADNYDQLAQSIEDGIFKR